MTDLLSQIEEKLAAIWNVSPEFKYIYICFSKLVNQYYLMINFELDVFVKTQTQQVVQNARVYVNVLDYVSYQHVKQNVYTEAPQRLTARCRIKSNTVMEPARQHACKNKSI